MGRKYQDFRNLNDYRLALLVLRKFAPQKFTAANGYDLRKWRDISAIDKKSGATIRKYYRQMRPLLVYGYQRRKVKNKSVLKAQYKALYGVTPLPGIDRIPLPTASDGTVNRVKFTRYQTGTRAEAAQDLVASVEVSPGVMVTRLSWAQMGYGWEDIQGANLPDTIRDLWATFQPDYVGMVAGHSRVKREGMYQVLNAPHLLTAYIQRLQNRYDSGNHAWSNWLEGLELYEFVEPPPEDEQQKRIQKQAKRQQFFSFLKDEEKRYKDRTKLTQRIKNIGRSLSALDKKQDAFLKTLKRVSKGIRDAAIKEAAPSYDKRRMELLKERDRLVTLLHLTKGF